MWKLRGTPYLSEPELRDRGWTAVSIRRFLKRHDAATPNPRHAGGLPMRLYLPARVEAAERTEAYKEFLRASLTRRAARRRPR